MLTKACEELLEICLEKMQTNKNKVEISSEMGYSENLYEYFGEYASDYHKITCFQLLQDEGYIKYFLSNKDPFQIFRIIILNRGIIYFEQKKEHEMAQRIEQKKNNHYSKNSILFNAFVGLISAIILAIVIGVVLPLIKI